MTSHRDDAVQTLTTRPTVLVDGQLTLRRAAELLSEEGIGAAVIRGSHPPALVSERDIVRAIADGANPDRERVDSIATYDVISAGHLLPVEDVARLMLDNEVRHVPITEDGVVTTVVSARDVLRALVDG